MDWISGGCARRPRRGTVGSSALLRVPAGGDTRVPGGPGGPGHGRQRGGNGRDPGLGPQRAGPAVPVSPGHLQHSLGIPETPWTPLAPPGQLQHPLGILEAPWASPKSSQQPQNPLGISKTPWAFLAPPGICSTPSAEDALWGVRALEGQIQAAASPGERNLGCWAS